MLRRKFRRRVDLVTQIFTRRGALKIVHSFERDGFEKTLEVFLPSVYETAEQDRAMSLQLLLDHMRVGLRPRDEIYAADRRRYDERQRFTGTQVLAPHEFFF